MEYCVSKVLELKFADSEIDTFLSVLDTMKKKATRVGFMKSFNKEQLGLIDSLHYNLIAQYEENNDKSK